MVAVRKKLPSVAVFFGSPILINKFCYRLAVFELINKLTVFFFLNNSFYPVYFNAVNFIIFVKRSQNQICCSWIACISERSCKAFKCNILYTENAEYTLNCCRIEYRIECICKCNYKLTVV